MRAIAFEVDQRNLGSPVSGLSRSALEVPVIQPALPDSWREAFCPDQRRAARMTATSGRSLVKHEVGRHVMAHFAPSSFGLKRQLFGSATRECHRQYDKRDGDQSRSTVAADTHLIRRAPN
jgi:hypothetical protein